jgi:molybdopterin/thiamine biosynthesis adenylyltransferase
MTNEGRTSTGAGYSPDESRKTNAGVRKILGVLSANNTTRDALKNHVYFRSRRESAVRELIAQEVLSEIQKRIHLAGLTDQDDCEKIINAYLKEKRIYPLRGE